MRITENPIVLAYLNLLNEEKFNEAVEIAKEANVRISLIALEFFANSSIYNQDILSAVSICIIRNASTELIDNDSVKHGSLLYKLVDAMENPEYGIDGIYIKKFYLKRFYIKKIQDRRRNKEYDITDYDDLVNKLQEAYDGLPEDKFKSCRWLLKELLA